MLWAWLSDNWFELAQTLSILSGIVFGVLAIRQNTKTRRLANLLTITGQHRDLWKQFTENKSLARVRENKRNMTKFPLTQEEEVFINEAILLFKTGFELLDDLPMVERWAVQEDADWFFSLPAPRAAWEEVKTLYPAKFRQMIDK